MGILMGRTALSGLLFPALAALTLLPACDLQHLQTRERADRGLVLVLPGIEGRSIWNTSLAQGLGKGVDCAVEVYEWGTGVPGGFLINLTDQQRNGIAADKLSRHITRYQKSHPGRQVHLVGHSGGAGLALMAVQRLPQGTFVESITLLAAAISPEYDLRPALLKTRQNIYNCYSANDAILLGAGTSLVGTIDRKYGQAAGMVGFRVPDQQNHKADGLYSRLRQRPWTLDLFRMGNDGSHFGWTNAQFAERWIAPVIQSMLDEARSKKITLVPSQANSDR